MEKTISPLPTCRDQANTQQELLVDLLADPEQVEKAAEQVERKLGPIDIWVNKCHGLGILSHQADET